MKIAICDDSLAQRNELEAFLSAREYEINTFESGTQLLNSLGEKTKYDIVFLDIQLTDILGTAIAKKILQISPNTDVVFISAYPQYVTEAFGLHVSQFLLKPLTKTAFLKELDRLLERRAKEKVCWYVPVKNGIYKFSPSDIIYIESYQRHLKIQTHESSFDVVGKLSDVEKIFYPYDYRRCHQGFLVNLRYIKRIQADTLICKPNFVVPISVRKRAEFLREYSRYIQKQS